MSSVYIRSRFYEMKARLLGSNKLLSLYQIELEPHFPSFADKIAEPRPDINIKDFAFIVTQKLYTTKLVVKESVAIIWICSVAYTH